VLPMVLKHGSETMLAKEKELIPAEDWDKVLFTFKHIGYSNTNAFATTGPFLRLAAQQARRRPRIRQDTRSSGTHQHPHRQRPARRAPMRSVRDMADPFEQEARALQQMPIGVLLQQGVPEEGLEEAQGWMWDYPMIHG
jgi:hypothetical protein